MTAPAWNRSGRLWSLLDIMRTFDLYTLMERLIDVDDDRNWCRRVQIIDGSDSRVLKPEWRRICQWWRELEGLAQAGRLPTAFAALQYAQADPDAPPLASQLEVECRHIKEMFLHDLAECKYLQVPSGLQGYVDSDALFGFPVAKAFPSARADVKAAGNCLAADCNTAAVFHMMRAVEWALRALGAHLGFRQLRAVKKSGKRKYVPISHLEWEKIIDQLQVRVDKRVERMRPGKRKQATQEFYYPVLQEVRAIRDAWRNHVMHSRSEYSHEDAMAVKGHVERLMVKLASRVSEV